MLVTSKRPRDLKWFLHAGPLLFGDWGTSRPVRHRAGVLLTAARDGVLTAAMSLVPIAVAWAYLGGLLLLSRRGRRTRRPGRSARC